VTRLWRIGASTAARPGPNDSIWEYDPAEPADEQGRRPSDRLVGSLLREDAERAVVCVAADVEGGLKAYIDEKNDRLLELAQRNVELAAEVARLRRGAP
jgi:hypothetical protein